LTDHVPLDQLLGTATGSFICWPVYDEETASDRLRQLRGLGVESVALGGRHGVLGHRVLGKGHVGVVLRCTWRGLEAALKARRTDADRPSMMDEAEHIRRANEAGVGPRLYAYSRDFIVMELLEGPYLGDWVRNSCGSLGDLRRVLGELLRQARSLDRAGLDHGELTRVHRHFILTGDGPRIIDFESASITRRTQNVTAAAQSMYLNQGFSRLLKGLIPLPDRDELIEALTDYKAAQTDDNFSRILALCGLEPNDSA